MSERPTLLSKLVNLTNFLRFCGFGFLALASVVFVLGTPHEGWELNGFTLVLALIAVAGVVMLLCSIRLVRILMGFGEMESPPITLNRLQD